MNKEIKPTFNYILNDIALNSLIARNLYSESADIQDKKDLEYQIELIQQENKQLKEELYEAQRQNNELEQDGQDIAKELSIRIDKALEILKLCNSKCAKETIEILKGEGDSNG